MKNSNRQPFPALDVTVICTLQTDCLLLGWLNVTRMPPAPLFTGLSGASLSFKNSVYLRECIWFHTTNTYVQIPHKMCLCYTACQVNNTCSGYWSWWNNFPSANCVSILKLLKSSCDVLHLRGFMDPYVLSHGGPNPSYCSTNTFRAESPPIPHNTVFRICFYTKQSERKFL